jgi:hypothetical protein
LISDDEALGIRTFRRKHQKERVPRLNACCKPAAGLLQVKGRRMVHQLLVVKSMFKIQVDILRL